jgi:hypothetical protein
MGPDGMSGDESDHANARGDKRYIIFQDEWRNPDLVQWIRVLDKVYISTKWNRVGRASKGNWVRARIPTTQRTTRQGIPVAGLPRNFYNPTWLKKLDTFELEDLHVKPAIELKHTMKLLTWVVYILLTSVESSLALLCRFAQQYEGVTGPGTPPNLD